MQNKRLAATTILFLSLCAALLCGCAETRAKPVIIWTDRAEIASYVELFNAQQNKAQAVVVYKSPLVSALPPAKDEKNPDIIIGSWLNDSRIKKNCVPLENLFDKKNLNPHTIYPSLLSYGTRGTHQYLLPVSFNLPLVIFASKNAELIPDAYMLSTDQIRDTAATCNAQNNHAIYTTMGFGPSWDAEFLYTVAKMEGLTFSEKGMNYQWDSAVLDSTVAYLKQWTQEKNTSTTAEQDFAFKYLYTPAYRQVESERCLFAYTSSERLFSVPNEQLGAIDFRWIDKDGLLPVRDAVVMMGIYKGSYNTHGASEFVIWLMQEETQRALLERAEKMQLNTQTFGIAGGFSALPEINERLFPTYYPTLLGNLPAADAIKAPSPFPLRWNSFKERVVIPYLADATNTEKKAVSSAQSSGMAAIDSIEDRILAWSMQFD